MIFVTAVPDAPAETDGAAAGKLPWSPPTLTEVPFDGLPVELHMMALGLPVPAEPEIRPEDLPF
jgi:hypothetical protein